VTDTPFFRLLKTPIEDKGEALATQIAALNDNASSSDVGEAGETNIAEPVDFRLIPGTPFAYWVSSAIRQLFETLPSFEPMLGEARTGLQSLGADELFIRAWWEVSARAVGKHRRWVCFAKGGTSVTWFGDVYLVTDWENDGETQKAYATAKYNSITRKITGMSLFFRPGLTYTTYTNKGFRVRALPADCIFSLAGPGLFIHNLDDVWWTTGCLNSAFLEFCLRLMTDRRKWEPGYVKLLPFARPSPTIGERLGHLAQDSFDCIRDLDRTDETTHAFCLPGLAQRRNKSLHEMGQALEVEAQATRTYLDAVQAEIDSLVFDVYRVSESDRALVRAEMEQELPISDSQLTMDDEDEESAPLEDPPSRVRNLLMWCVGVAFGRWDVRMALDSTLLPALQEPFDPLPRCAPGALVGIDGLPPANAADIPPEAWLRARKNVLDLPKIDDGAAAASAGYPQSLIAWDGILVDDPTHPSDIVTRVRDALVLLWGERAGDIEQEACKILGYQTLRDYFRDPRKGFFAFHIKRYSKSRRKAPIYWLLQSERRSYAIWLYCHRMNDATLYKAGRDYADAKVKLEETRLADLRQGLDALTGSARKRGEAAIEAQQKLVDEVVAFRNRLDALALLNLPPDLNDGVVISIAPLRELVPWKEAQATWEKLLAGEYAWSTMAKQIRTRGLVK